jgi:predicted RNase H-like HicB family nuclease
MLKYVVLIKKTDDGYSAAVPDIPECTATGATVSEVEDLIYQVIQKHLDTLAKENRSLPPAVTESEIMIFVD